MPTTATGEEIMKTVISAAIGLSLLAGFAAPADAASRAKKHRYQATQGGQYQAYKRAPDAGGYYEHIADKLPFGSSIWWEQMSRERRSGRPG
jgi:hypothetical protein